MEANTDIENIEIARALGIRDGVWVRERMRKGMDDGDMSVLLSDAGLRIGVGDVRSLRIRIRNEIACQSGGCDGCISLWDDAFPHILEGVPAKQRPLMLFYAGDIGLLGDAVSRVAVVGSRNIAEKEAEATRKASRIVAEKNVIVSGLAVGCDTIAHEEALLCATKTIAILADAPVRIYPAVNIRLAQEIVMRGGLLISEYWRKVGDPAEYKRRLIERDRLQAMFSDGVLLAHSMPSGGARHAMSKAGVYGVPTASLISDARIMSDNDAEVFTLGDMLVRGGKATGIRTERMRDDLTRWLERIENMKNKAKWEQERMW